MGKKFNEMRDMLYHQDIENAEAVFRMNGENPITEINKLWKKTCFPSDPKTPNFNHKKCSDVGFREPRTMLEKLHLKLVKRIFPSVETFF